MIDISWHQLQENSKSKELNFESFCNQIVRKKYASYGRIEEYYNTAGSEFYLKLNKDCDELNLKKGDIIGWQAKFWLNSREENNSPLDSSHRNELIEGFRKSLEYKSDLKYWIICTPGKFLNTKPSRPWDSLCKSLKQIKPDIQLDHWHKETFESIFHLDSEEYSSIFNHYFNLKFIGKDLLNNLTRLNLNQLERKFDVDIHIKDINELNLLTSVFPDYSYSEISKYIKLLEDQIEKFNDDHRIKFNDFNDLSEELIHLMKCYYLKHVEIINELRKISIKPQDIILPSEQIRDVIIAFIDKTEQDRKELNKNLKPVFKKSAKISFGEQDWLQFMIEGVNSITNLLIGKDKDTSLLISVERISSKDIHVFGAAGFGKTHFACSIAYQVLKENKPVLLLLGSSFKNTTTPQEKILQSLDLDKSFTFNDFIGAIDNLASLYECKIPIIIDGLNESFPSANAIWNNEIYSIIRDIRKKTNIIFLTTCRDKHEYIQQIFDKKSYKDVNNNIYLKGFTEKNIPLAVEKYFNKYKIEASLKPYDITLFGNPLRLKIFCEVNKGKKNLDINLYSVVQSIESYIDELIKNISKTNGCINKVKRAKLNNGLNKLGELLWETNSRDISFDNDFCPLFEFNDELVFNLIDEGLCFQRDLNKDEELVQYTYDLVAGYQIAKSVFFSNNNENSILPKLQSDITREKLFSEDKSKRHPLHEDIIKSITYLLPEKIGKQIYEIIPDESILNESIGNIELLASNQSEKIKLNLYISSISLKPESIIRLLQQLYDDVVQRNNFNTFDIINSVFLKLNQFEIDNFWNELIRKDSYKLQLKLKQIAKTSKSHEDNIESRLLFVLLLTGSTDKLLRNEATKNLMLLGLKYPKYLLKLAKGFKLVNDGFILESLICSLSGVVLRLKDKEITTSVIKFLEEDFLVTNRTNHVSILDYIQTVFYFGLTQFDIKCDSSILLRNKNESWNYNKEKTKDVNKDFWSYEMMDYDFIKHQVTSLSNRSYDRISKYSKAEIIMLISEKIREKGYELDKYSVLEANINDDNKYRREEVSEQVIKYSEKYLNITYQELAGFLMLNAQIYPEFENTFRFKYVFFDPTFPTIPNKQQLINDCLLPAYNEDIQKWIIKDSSKLLESLHVTIPVFESSEMVLLRASLTQENKDNNTRITIYISSFVFNKAIKKRITKLFDDNFYEQDEEKYQIFAGEIPWRKYTHSEQSGFVNQDAHPPDYYPLVTDYSWSSWTSDRFRNPHFAFLNTKIANEMGLDFNVEHLSYIDKDRKTVTKYYHTDNSEFLYIDREILEKYFKEKKLDLVWNKFIAKYGEFSKHDEKKLNPSYTDFNNCTIYSEVIKSDL